MHGKLSKPALQLPKVVFGTSGLGNLFTALPFETKLEIVREIFAHSTDPVVFDSAGKYGAGLALESLGECLKALNIPQEKVIISNKLGWKRISLTTEEPTFEPGVWKDLEFDAEQRISYEGIIECFEQGNELLGGYKPQLVSVHDPDEYLARAQNDEEDKRYYRDIFDAYLALQDLKTKGLVNAIGVGAKDWRVIQRISKHVELDWVMFANSMTIKQHPGELIEFMKSLEKEGVHIINSAVFHSGFLIGGEYYDYKLIHPDNFESKELFSWRESFFEVCEEYGVKPAHACIQFGLKIPGVKSIALNTTNAARVMENFKMVENEIEQDFWHELIKRGLIEFKFPQLNEQDFELPVSPL
jgi:D-threo-aldose 1-dehydrogenase